MTKYKLNNLIQIITIIKIDQLQKSKDLNVLELEKLKNVRNKHSNDKKQEIEKLKTEIDNVQRQKKDRGRLLEKDTNSNLDSLKKDNQTKVLIFSPKFIFIN